jgi:hypothetical protein
MAAGRRDFERALRDPLAAHVAEVSAGRYAPWNGGDAGGATQRNFAPCPSTTATASASAGTA